MGGKCDYPVCPGRHHKFEDCWTEALYSLSGHGGLCDDGQTGNTEWRVYACLFTFTESAQFSRETTGMEFDVFFAAGVHWIVYCNDQGFVWSEVYASRVEAENKFNEIDRAYSEWLEENGD